MRFNIAVTCFVFPIIFAFNEEYIDLAVSYFKEKHTFFVCVLTCDSYTHKFAKVASDNNLATSSVNLISLEAGDKSKIDSCLSQTLSSVGVLINAKCPQFETIVTYASQNNLFDSNHKWVIIYNKIGHLYVNEKPKYSESTTDINIFSTFSNLNLTINTDIVVIASKGVSRYNLYDVYNFGKQRNGRFVVEVIGDWNNVTGLNITGRHKYHRRFDYHGMFLKLIFVMAKIPKVFNLEMVLSWNPDPSVSILTHTGFIVLHEIAEIHNIRFNYTILDIWVGDYNREHTYAVTNSLYFGDQDITPVLRMLPAHIDKYDVTFPVSNVETRYFYRIPSHGIGKFENQFLTPLSPSTWWCFVGISVLCGIVLLLSVIHERRPISLPYAIFSILALICQQYFEEYEPMQKISSVRKLIMLITGLFCLLIYNYYTSSVVSWLLNAPPPSINSLWELLDSPLQPVLEDTGYTYSWLQLKDYYYNKKYARAEDELKKRLLSLKKKGKPIIKFVKDGIAMVKDGGYVYHVEVDSANKIIAQTFDQRELCDLGSLLSMEKALVYITVQKNSPFKEFFVWSALRLKETGVLKRIQLRTWGHASRCEGSSPRALALGGAAPAFIVLCVGYLVAVIMVLIERLIWNHQIRMSKSKLYNVSKIYI